MAKIITIDNDTVTVSLDDSSTIEVAKTEFNFPISENMQVDTHKHNDTYIFSQPTPTNADDIEVPEGKVAVNKVPYGLFFFFLGQLGIHEFYAGNHKKGVIWIVVSVVIRVISYMLQKQSIFFAFIGLIYVIIVIILAIITLCKTSKNGKILVNKF